ncbi:MAG TPA: DUF1028 domain-containing protein [Chloroflexia bacterium]|nr:DUF1028 domain-containing protein [Chloroflexia bacterium]
MVLLPKICTFSIVAHDPHEQSWGVAVASRYLAVGAIVPYARAGAGAIATQSIGNPLFGLRGLELLAQGFEARAVIEQILENDELCEDRQLGIVDARGEAATFTGASCSEWAGGITGPYYAAQGNTLVSAETVRAMAATFEKASGSLADRLYAALAAGDRAGGDNRGKQAASLLVVKPLPLYQGQYDRFLDLRVDDHSAPLDELGRLLQKHHLYHDISPEEEKIRIDRALAVELEALLAKSGFYKGETTGDWNTDAQAALTALADRENLEDRVNASSRLIDPPALAYFRQL